MSDRKIQPISCSQCGAHLEVDPLKEKVICPYCGTSYLTHDLLHAKKASDSEKGAALNTVLDFVGEQMSDSRRVRLEQRKQEKADQRAFFLTCLKVFPLMFFVLIALWFVLRFTGFFDDAEFASTNWGSTAEQGEEVHPTVDYTILDDSFVQMEVTNPYDDIYWDVDTFETDLAVEDITEGTDGYIFNFSVNQEKGTARAVIGEYEAETDEPLYYAIVTVEIEDYEIVSHQMEFVESLDE